MNYFKIIIFLCTTFLYLENYSQTPPNPFVTTWQTDGSSRVMIPLTGGNYDFTIDWGDGTTEIKTGAPGNISHTYSIAGVKTVSITPNITTGFPRIYINNFGNRNLLQTIESWGSGQWGASVDRAFYGAANLEVNATDIPDFSATTNFQYMFMACTSVTGTNGFANWTLNTNPTATISFSNMFKSTTLFNGDISNWDVSRVNTFDNMFNNAASFNQNIGSWNVANATNMSSMFRNADAFNIDISAWDVSLVTNMTEMFSYNDLFNKNLSNWNVSSVTNMNFMFFRATNFNSPLNWGNKTGNVTNMSGMFKEAVVFNQDIGNWDVSSVTNLGYMFRSAIAFNKDLSNWDVSSVTSMAEMFYGASGFNSPLNWGNKTASVTNMSTMFYGASTFNQDLNSWNVSSVISFGQMFHGAQAFNENISNWQFTTDVTKTISMASMFRNASSFNQNISGWNVKRVNQMQRMFQNTPFNQDISIWDISRVSNLQYFLSDAKLSRANYNALLLGWSTLDAGETLVPINLNAHFGSSKYSDTAAVLAARNTTLIANKNWTITDGGMDADVLAPIIESSTLASNNATISITFSENVYRTDVGSGVLETTDFLFSLSGGTATLNSSIPNSITTTTNLTFELGLDINGTPNGAEVLTVTPILNAIFDISGNAATTTQSNNTAQLNDVTVPVITGPSSETGVNSAVSLHENIASVFTFSADETVSWSLGNTNDDALFSIDNNGNLVFIVAPDYEIPSSVLNSNTYVVDIIATDAASNTTTQTLTITILDIANSTLGTFAPITKNYFTGTHTIAPPTTNNTNPIIYTSDNTAVATISGSVITFTGVGTANITATQAADANYEGNSVSALLTVIGKNLVSKYGGISSTDVNYTSATGSVGGSLGLDKYGKTYEIFESPDAPIISSVTADNTQASISFTAPANTGGLPITSYTATSSPGNFTGTLTQAGSGTITVTGLTNGTAYTFTVVATNAVGVSNASAASNAVTPLPPPSIGDFRGGGVVFYVAPTPTDLDGDGDLDTVLVCSIVDQNSGIQWYNGSYTTTGATNRVIGSGSANTAAILANQSTTATDYAAGIAQAYNGGGYTDWFLPSWDEMLKIVTHKNQISNASLANGGTVVRTDYPNNFYWSSTEYNNTTAIVLRINPTGGPPTYGWNKNLTYRVRAVRAF